jgi:hypothetical protein
MRNAVPTVLEIVTVLIVLIFGWTARADEARIIVDENGDVWLEITESDDEYQPAEDYYDDYSPPGRQGVSSGGSGAAPSHGGPPLIQVGPNTALDPQTGKIYTIAP